MENVHKIEVGISNADGIKKAILTDLGIKGVTKVEVINVYILEGVGLSDEDLTFLGEELFSDPIVEQYSIDKPLKGKFDGSIAEVGYKPGVTDNVGKTTVEAVKDALTIELNAAYSLKQYIFYGIDVKTADIIVRDLLANELIERWNVKKGQTYTGFDIFVPKVKLEKEPTVETIDLDVSDEDLLKISHDRVLALNLEEMRAIKDHFISTKDERQKLGLTQNPTDVELECLAQTWSEHCKHKIFNALIEYNEGDKRETIDSLFKTYIKGATDKINSDYLVSVFKDNAGVIQFNEDYTVCMKVETHNSPTALDPYGGALTGIVGCNRDPAGTGKGFKLIFNTDVFCFGSPFYEGEIPPRLFHPRRVLKGVHKGIIDGGNQSGIPTVNGSLYFDKRFSGKPLVFCGTGGIAPTIIDHEPTHEKKPKINDLAVMVGGRIGADGIHGATFSSLEINENSPATAVQIGSPIVQKKMLDFLLEARDRKLINAITDNGAGGLSSSFGEMGEDVGVRLDLEKPPLKYSGLMPWEILLSEAQERMSVAVSPKNLDKFMNLAKKHSVEATVVGEFNGSKEFQLYYNGQLAGNIPMKFLHDGVPQKHMKGIWNPKNESDPNFDEPKDYNTFLKEMLGRLNICSKEESIVRRYDHEVQGKTIIKPFVGLKHDGPSDSAILRPLFKSWEGLAVSHGLCPRFSDIDTYHMAANAIDEAVRNAVCTGGDPDYMAGLDNFCWAMGFDEKDEIKYTGLLVRANKALYDITTHYNLPLISGKDSMRNDYKIGDNAVSVPPTLMFSVISKVPDIRKAVTMDVKNEGDLVYLLGITKKEFGSTEYYQELELKGGKVPKVEPKSAIERYRKYHQAVKKDLIESGHDCSDGGLAVALAESAFAGAIGMKINLSKVPATNCNRNDEILFSESPSRLIITIKPENKNRIESIFEDQVISNIGTVIGNKLKIKGLDGNNIVNEDVSELKLAWQKTLHFLTGRVD
ncbi:MAG: phosphoribosylformylglycinamidine synthase [Candidatus Lokiarchaeota archaeon]|nr:phosphoribosylformylglycinamidine synthase [Candidatus Lokiarchaeota archaeon]